MANSSFDDEFGGFEEAPAVDLLNNSQVNIPTEFLKQITETKVEASIKPQSTNIPEWLISQQTLNTSTNSQSFKSSNSSLNNQARNSQILDINETLLRQLKDELVKTKEDLSQKQLTIQHLQEKHRFELDEKSSQYNVENVHREIQAFLKQSLLQQKEACMRECRVLLDQQSREQELKFAQKLKEIQAKYEAELNYKLEEKMAEFQEKLIIQNESFNEDLELKVRKIVSLSFNEEKQIDKVKLKQNFDQVEKELKSDMEKYVQNFFKNQSEIFKEQIKSGVQQEHLIHKDLINSKLEKLFKASEEKRRSANLLFSRHLSGLTFFIENAHKQLLILNQAHSDLLKNKELVDFYGNNTSSLSVEAANGEMKDELKSFTPFLNSFSPFGQSSTSNNKSKDDFKIDEPLIDEELLTDLA